MVYVQSPGQQETDEKFGHLWFASLARFHKVRNSHTWDFDNDHVIEFLRSKLSEKMPTWKRLKIVQGLIWYRNNEGNPYNSEKAYVGKVKAFMKDFGLQTLADFDDIGATEVGSFDRFSRRW